jgi:hypothetical protein
LRFGFLASASEQQHARECSRRTQPPPARLFSRWLKKNC